ncbi:hypothetical protein [Sinosporangium siamense]|uniref:Uncharacterized protein n=1 Tax=Sinosporangium siamense TaxID=1367973 RepID=A0A919REM1_9ACTN|nr:hypothetical protein [Sinosporangium siamense]GII92287.1 hypothetical protein Ssi02_25180 [Sinosporangium siamense]
MSNDLEGLTRRRFVSTLGALAVVSTTLVHLPDNAYAAVPVLGGPNGPTSENGWPIIDGKSLKPMALQGSDATVTVVSGAVATILEHVLRRFHYEIDTLGAEEVYSHSDKVTGGVAFESNYQSGTAVAIRPTVYPVGVAGGFFPNELLIIRDILAECDGVVSWGGDDRRNPKEGHFQIDVPPRSHLLGKVARKFDQWDIASRKGAGFEVDPFAPDRLAAAAELKAKQAPE